MLNSPYQSHRETQFSVYNNSIPPIHLYIGIRIYDLTSTNQQHPDKLCIANRFGQFSVIVHLIAEGRDSTVAQNHPSQCGSLKHQNRKGLLLQKPHNP